MAKGKKKGKKVKKVSYSTLLEEFKEVEGYKTYYQTGFLRLNAENEVLKKSLRERLDTSMLKERAEVLRALASLTNGITLAIQMVVGKEVM